MFGRLIIIE